MIVRLHCEEIKHVLFLSWNIAEKMIHVDADKNVWLAFITESMENAGTCM